MFVSEGDEVALATSLGQSIRFKEKDIRIMGRNAGGVRAMKLKKGDILIGGGIVKNGSTSGEILVVGENGYGKKTSLKEYKVQKRGGSGIKTAKVTGKNGKLIAAHVVTEEKSEIVAISKKSQVIRTDLKDIPSLGRQTQGVRIMRLREGDHLASIVCL